MPNNSKNNCFIPPNPYSICKVCNGIFVRKGWPKPNQELDICFWWPPSPYLYFQKWSHMVLRLCGLTQNLTSYKPTENYLFHSTMKKLKMVMIYCREFDIYLQNSSKNVDQSNVIWGLGGVTMLINTLCVICDGRVFCSKRRWPNQCFIFETYS